MKKIFKLKNLFLVTFLAVAGFFSTAAIITNNQVEETPVVEKAEATSNGSTSETTRFIWIWDAASIQVKPYISYYDTTWHHLNAMKTDSTTKTSGAYSAVAYYDVPSGVSKLIFIHSSNGSSWTNQTADLNVQVDGTTVQNIYSWTNNSWSDGKINGSWGRSEWTKEETYLYWTWSGNKNITPYISYVATTDTTCEWNHKKAMSTGDAGSSNGIAYYRVPANTYFVIFSNTSSWNNGQTTTCYMVSGYNGGVKNVCTSSNISSNNYPNSWSYSYAKRDTRIVWSTSGGWWVQPYIKYLCEGSWSTAKRMFGSNGQEITSATQNCKCYYVVPKGTVCVILMHESTGSGSTGRLLLQSETTKGKTKNLCVSTVDSSSFSASWSSCWLSEDGVYINPCSGWAIPTDNKSDTASITRAAVYFYDDIFGSSATFSKYSTQVTGKTFFEAQVPGTNAAYKSCIVMIHGGVTASDTPTWSGSKYDQTIKISPSDYYDYNYLDVRNDTWSGGDDDGHHMAYAQSDYCDEDRAELWGNRFITVHTNGTCVQDGSTNRATLITKWSAAKGEYTHSSKTTQGMIWKADENTEGTYLQQAVARYDYILYKYGSDTTNFDDFISRKTSGKYPYSSIHSFSSNVILNVFSKDNSSIIIIIIASSVALLSITALSVLLVKKRKRKEF